MAGYRLIFFALLIFFANSAQGQLSDGGMPLDVSFPTSLKSSSVVALPPQNNNLLLKNSLAQADSNQLKPFRFAVPLPVSLNPENSGRWIEMEDYRIWQLVLVSSEAKSLNLLFDRYHLPDGARLYLFSADQSDLLGAFTSRNNQSHGGFASSPVLGDRLVLQYEEPVDAAFRGELSISQVNHDFVGVKALKYGRRPLGHMSGSCNINVNCDWVNAYRDEKNAVCRIIVSGIDLCTGTLVNNTRNDGTPYVYTAGHCISSNKEANESVFLFNYESPYCGEIDGDASHSLSGSALRAMSDSLDFSLVELGTKPPAEYRPYYLGWDRSLQVPDSSATIHHPQGDVKKISIDRHSPRIKTYSYDYTKDAFFLIGNWEEGTTEGGSSGAPLLNPDKLLIGSLTGGAATCEHPYGDYFARLAIAWEYYPLESKQLKRWLDPTNTNLPSITGFSPYEHELQCSAYTNFRDEDSHAKLEIVEGGVSKGYWSGNNTYGYVEFAERFEKTIRSEIIGVSMGVGELSLAQQNSESKITVKVYSGEWLPDTLLYAQDFSLQDLDEGVMNYLAFDQKVATKGPFYVAYSLELLEEEDVFSVFLADRKVDPLNSFLIKDGSEWYTYPEKTTTQGGSALLMEVVLCNIDALPSEDDLKNTALDFDVFPNPFRSGQDLLFKFQQTIDPHLVQVVDLMGRQVSVPYRKLGDNWLRFDFAGLVPGNYIINILEADPKRRYTSKVIYLGDY